MFIFRTQRWKVSRVSRPQIAWDPRHLRGIYAYEVTLSNGAWVVSAQHKWLAIAWLHAHWKRLNYHE
jgi:hypothetical protein